MSEKNLPAVKPAFKDWNFIDDGRLEHREYGINHAYVSQYGPDTGCAGQWFWNVDFGHACLKGILPSVDEAVGRVNELIAMPVELFIEEAADEILMELKSLLQKLTKIGATHRFDAYEIGFEHGCRQTRIDICSAVVKLIKDGNEEEGGE